MGLLELIGATLAGWFASRKMASLNDLPAGFPPLGAFNFSSRAMSSSTALVNELGGAPICIAQNTGSTPGTLTPRTAAQMFTDANLQVGQSWFLLLSNDQGTGTLTLGTASGFSVSGTATAAANTCTPFYMQATAANTIVATRLFTFTTAA